MQVILLERIGRLGQMGDVVTVKDGFARNFLLPQGKALRATETNRKRFERERAQLEARDLELKGEADVPADVRDRAATLDAARAAKDYATADSIRAELVADGWIVETTAHGTAVRR